MYYPSDHPHSLIRACFSTSKPNVRGRGFWKFNTTLLHDKYYVDEIKNLIRRALNIYMSNPVHQMIWELIKQEIRIFTVPYCVGKSREKKTCKKDLNVKYKMLDAVINSDELIDQSFITELYRTKHDLETLER